MTGKRQQGLYIILSAVFLSLAVTLVDAFLQPDYVPKVLVKILFFLLLPLFYFSLFLNSLGSAEGAAYFQAKILPGNFSVFPSLICTSVTGCYLHFVTSLHPSADCKVK